MEAIRKQIHSALFSVSRLCQQFFRKYPQYYPPQMPYEGYPAYQYGSYVPVVKQFPPPTASPWSLKYGHQSTLNLKSENLNSNSESKSKVKDLKSLKTHKSETPMSKKSTKEQKKQQKKMELQRQQREREKQRRRQDTLKKKKKERNTLKNQIKKDPRFAYKPKFPMSPYFLFLQQMRLNPTTKLSSSPTSNKEFAESMGKAWRQMNQDKKKPYITTYLKQKRIYDEKIKQFYVKYPDLKPKGSSKDEKPMYSVNDPKYQVQTANDEQELESDLLDQLQSQQDSLSFQKQPTPQVKRKQMIQNDKSVEWKINNLGWIKRKDSLSDERLTSEINNTNSPTQIVQID